MAFILNIETSTQVCSVALAKDGINISTKESHEGKSHANLLTVFIDEILKEQHISVQELDAVAVSQGPGSYTGLRIGVSTAKGIAYGAGIPLIAVDTLQSMAKGLLSMNPDSLTNVEYLIPMIDARRMEVYASVWNKKMELVEAVQPVIIEEDSFSGFLNKSKALFFGDGASKCKETLIENSIFCEDYVISANHMSTLSEELFTLKKFVDVAYFEPFYLKEFMATTPKNKVLGKQINKS